MVAKDMTIEDQVNEWIDKTLAEFELIGKNYDLTFETWLVGNRPDIFWTNKNKNNKKEGGLVMCTMRLSNDLSEHDDLMGIEFRYKHFLRELATWISKHNEVSYEDTYKSLLSSLPPASRMSGKTAQSIMFKILVKLPSDFKVAEAFEPGELFEENSDHWRQQLRKEMTEFNQHFGIYLRNSLKFNQHDKTVCHLGGDYEFGVLSDSLSFSKEKRFELWKKAYARKIKEWVDEGYEVELQSLGNLTSAFTETDIIGDMERMMHPRYRGSDQSKTPLEVYYKVIVSKPNAWEQKR